MEEKKTHKKWINAALILALLGDLCMIALFMLSRKGIAPISFYPPFLHLTGFLLVLLGILFSLAENNMK